MVPWVKVDPEASADEALQQPVILILILNFDFDFDLFIFKF